MFKVETVEQFKVLEFLKENFDMSYIELKLVNKFSIKVSDIYNDEMIFKFNVKTGKIDFIELSEDEYIEF